MISCSGGMFDYYCEFSLHCKSSTTLRSHPQIGGMSITARLQRLLLLLLNYARPGLLLQLGSLLLVLIFLRIWARPLPPAIHKLWHWPCAEASSFRAQLAIPNDSASELSFRSPLRSSSDIDDSYFVCGIAECLDFYFQRRKGKA